MLAVARAAACSGGAGGKLLLGAAAQNVTDGVCRQRWWRRGVPFTERKRTNIRFSMDRGGSRCGLSAGVGHGGRQVPHRVLQLAGRVTATPLAPRHSLTSKQAVGPV